MMMMPTHVMMHNWSTVFIFVPTCDDGYVARVKLKPIHWWSLTHTTTPYVPLYHMYTCTVYSGSHPAHTWSSRCHSVAMTWLSIPGLNSTFLIRNHWKNAQSHNEYKLLLTWPKWGGTGLIWGEVWPNFFFTYVKHWMETFIIIMQTLREHIKHM